MAKNSKKAKFLKIIQGGKAELAKSVKSLTHKDIKEFFAKFAEVIWVDQERVNKLPHKKFHPFYDDGMWQRCRERHVGAIVDLSMTVDEMPKRLLKELTELATNYRLEAVKLPLLNIISDLANGVTVPGVYDTASLFFSELIKDVSRQDQGISRKGHPTEMISKWFGYDTNCHCERFRVRIFRSIGFAY
jgi:hypothetical protein